MSVRCCMPSFKIIDLLVLEKKIFKGFYHIWTWWLSWWCDLNHLFKLWFPLPKDAPNKIWLWLAKWFQWRRSLKMVDDGRMTEGRRLDGYTISSPCEPNRSGELIIIDPVLGIFCTCPTDNRWRLRWACASTPSLSICIHNIGRKKRAHTNN